MVCIAIKKCPSRDSGICSFPVPTQVLFLRAVPLGSAFKIKNYSFDLASHKGSLFEILPLILLLTWSRAIILPTMAAFQSLVRQLSSLRWLGGLRYFPAIFFPNIKSPVCIISFAELRRMASSEPFASVVHLDGA